MTPAYPQLMDALCQLRRHWRQQKLAEGILLTLAAASVVLVAVVALDNLFQPETSWRLLLALALWGSLATAVIGLIVRRWLEDRRDDYFAALVEEKHPELRNQLINALQLGRGSQVGSPRLIEAIVRDAVNATADLEMTSCLDARTIKRAGLLAALAVLLIAGYAVAFGSRFTNGLARILLPGANIPAYTLTQVDETSVKPGDTRVPEGNAVSIEARVTGLVPAEAQLHRRTAEQSWRRPEPMPPDPKAEAIFCINLPQVTESFDYYIAAGDGRSRTYHVEVVRRPQVENLAVTYAFPEYTGLAPRTVAHADGEITGLLGTRVTVEVKSTKPLKKASLALAEPFDPGALAGNVLPLDQGPDSRTWRGSFVLWSRGLKPAAGAPEIPGQRIHAPNRYQVKLQDTDGYDNADPLWRPISVIKDQPPTVAIPTPGRDVQRKPDATVRLGVVARDDYGVGDVRILYRVNEDQTVRELKHWSPSGEPQRQTQEEFVWELARSGLKAGDLVQYWATVTDRNNLTGPGTAESRRFSLFVLTPEAVVAKLELQIRDFADLLESLVRLQIENRVETAKGADCKKLVTQEQEIRTRTRQLARAMEKEAFPLATVIKALNELHAGLMAEAVSLLEQGKVAQDADDLAKATAARTQSLPVQDKIIAQLQELLERLRKDEKAREALRRMEKKDQAAHKVVTKTLNEMIKDLKQMLAEKAMLAEKFEKMPRKTVDKLDESSLKALKDFEDFQEKWGKWAKGKVDELAKLPTGFVDDFGLRPDVNKVFEEIEKQAVRQKAEKVEVSLEDLGSGMATKMKEDLEVWLPDSPDNLKWVLEEPLDKKPMNVPEMPLPKTMEDLVGDLLQKADEFDEEADDITSAWGDNLDQAGWGTGDGPISLFSSKGKTGNDLPNSHELTGRSGDGRRGKSAGQMTGDTSRALPGRDTPARVGQERYEPGQLKQEGQDDPKGATGGGKKSGAGRRGLQGGAPPDFVKDMGRLGQKQMALREKAEQVAQKLETLGITSRRLNESIRLMKSSEQDLRDKRYEDAARRRRVALSELKAGLKGVDQATAVQLNRAHDLPAQLRTELLQASEENYPEGYEGLLKNYFKALSTTEK
jgi:hypothetical protein